MAKPKKPKWQSSSILSRPLRPFPGDCSFDVYNQVIAAERRAKLLMLLDCYGISRDDRDAGWKLAAKLALEHVTGMQVAATPGTKTEVQNTIDDVVIYASVALAKEKNPAATDRQIIRDWAKANGRPTTGSYLESKRRRLLYARKRGSQHQKGMAGLLAGILPQLEARLEILQKKKK